jgi:hypothetical protein
VLELLSYGFWYQSVEEVTARGDMPFLESFVKQLTEEAKMDVKVRRRRLVFGAAALRGRLARGRAARAARAAQADCSHTKGTRTHLHARHTQLTRPKPASPISMNPQEGYNPDLKFMSHLWDALPASYRPLTFYAITESMDCLTRAMLWAAGLRRHDVCGHVYYTLDGDAKLQPVLLMHGVGAGVLPYFGLIFKFAATGACGAKWGRIAVRARFEGGAAVQQGWRE